jgi:hypothetical protein
VRREARSGVGAEVGGVVMVRLSVRLGHHVAFACSVQGEERRRLQACSSLVLGFVTMGCLVCLFLPSRSLSVNSVRSEDMKSRGLVFGDNIRQYCYSIIPSCVVIDGVVVYWEAGGRGDGARAKRLQPSRRVRWPMEARMGNTVAASYQPAAKRR